MERLHPDDIQAIAAAVAVRLAPEALMTIDDIAAHSRYSRRQVAERIVKRVGFPAQKQPGRYARHEVLEYFDQRPRKSGAKRKDPGL